MSKFSPTAAVEESECPEKMVLEMRPEENLAKVKIPFYENYIKLDQDLKIKPSWIRNENGFMLLNKGIHDISFFISNSDGEAICSVRIVVLGNEKSCREFLWKFLFGWLILLW